MSCLKTCRRWYSCTTPRILVALWRCQTWRPVSAATSPTRAVICSRTARDSGPMECSTHLDRPSTAVSAPSPIFMSVVLYLPFVRLATNLRSKVDLFRAKTHERHNFVKGEMVLSPSHKALFRGPELAVCLRSMDGRPRAGLSIVPVVPWEGAPRRQGPPISCQIFYTLFWRLNVRN